jgi:hypothetical protein
MSTPSATRHCLSSATALCFVVVALTGVLMFFHVRLPAIRLVHELLSLVLVVAGTWHLVLNFKCLLRYLETRAARMTLGIGLVLCTLLVVLGLSHPEHAGRGPHGRGPMMGEAYRHD